MVDDYKGKTKSANGDHPNIPQFEDLLQDGTHSGDGGNEQEEKRRVPTQFDSLLNEYDRQLQLLKQERKPQTSSPQYSDRHGEQEQVAPLELDPENQLQIPFALQEQRTSNINPYPREGQHDVPGQQCRSSPPTHNENWQPLADLIEELKKDAAGRKFMALQQQKHASDINAGRSFHESQTVQDISVIELWRRIQTNLAPETDDIDKDPTQPNDGGDARPNQ